MDDSNTMTTTDKFFGIFFIFLAMPAVLIMVPAIEVAIVIGLGLVATGLHMLLRRRRRCGSCGHFFNVAIPQHILLLRRQLKCPHCNSHIRKKRSTE